MGKISVGLNKVDQISVEKDYFNFKSDNGFGAIKFYRDSVVNVRISRDKIPKKSPSFAVIQKPEKIKPSYVQDEGSLSLESHKIRLELNLKNACLSFFDKNSKLISRDALSTRWTGTEVTVCKELMQDEKFVGLGEKTGPLNRRGNAYVNWNTDKFGYAVDEDPLYLSTPFYIGIHNGLVYGIFVDNSHKTTFNFGASTDRFSWFSAEDGLMNYYFIYGNTVADIIEDYTWLTGRMKLPPLWSLGFQQCRYSYYPDSEIYQLAQTFREKKIPCDVLYLDIHYMQDYKAFTFHEERFPEPAKMIAHIRESGFKTAVILDPGIKVEKGYPPYDSGISEEVFVKYPDGENYTGEVWPGKSHFPDFTAAKVRKWWQRLLPFYADLGIKGFWNDMNEPAAWGQCLPNFLEFDFEGQKTTHREARNVYGMQMARATAEGVHSCNPSERPFVLTRAGFSGIQRFSAVWTGDNVSSDEHLMAGVRLVNSLGLTGISFCGNDAGGFVGEASPELYARWISVAAFQPFFRAHSNVNTRDAEPWSFGEIVEQIARNYIGLRYKLMPLIYSLMRESSVNGMPLCRSFVFEHPHHENTYREEFQHQFFMGRDLMVCPLESAEKFLKIWLPPGLWFNFWTGEELKGDREIIVEAPLWKLPVFVRAGALIPMQELSQHLDEKPKSLILHVYGKGSSTFSFYQDDGASYNYENKDYKLREIVLQENSLLLNKSIGNYPSELRDIKIIFHGISPENIKVNGLGLKTEKVRNRFVEPVYSIDTFSEDKGRDMYEENLTQITLDYSDDEMMIKW